jgi:hypothetical protein
MRSLSDFGVDFGDNSCEFLEVNDSISVPVSELNHLVDLGACEVLSD